MFKNTFKILRSKGSFRKFVVDGRNRKERNVLKVSREVGLEIRVSYVQ